MKIRNSFLTLAFVAAALMGCSKVAVSDLKSTGTDGINGGNGSPTDPTTHNTSVMIKAQTQKVDLLFVLDNSGSMKPDALSLASKLGGFVQKLEAFSLDWQMCMTTTDYMDDDGASLSIEGVARTENWILKKGDTNISDKLFSTINNLTFGVNNTGDERGVASMSRHLAHRASNHCYRPGAAVSVIIISDEDERSVGGVQSLDANQYRPIEAVDLPENYVSQVQSALGSSLTPVAHTVHSIIIQPGDQSCLAEQNNQGYPGYVGTFYHKLSGLTGGSEGSICSSDFSQSLSVFADQIQKSLQRVKLDCAPAAGWKITTSPSVQNVQAHVESNYLVIETPVPQDTLVNVQYTCQ